MYHYYVRFSIYYGAKIIGDSYCEIETQEIITELDHIIAIADMLANNLKEEIELTHVIIDFYKLLRKDAN